MALNILIDMNLTPAWVQVFTREGWKASHWSEVGLPTAADSFIMQWARDNHAVVFTHDLDFSLILGLTNAKGPSVMQLRGNDVLPASVGQRVVSTLRRFETELKSGAIVVIDEARSRLRLLPLNPSNE